MPAQAVASPRVAFEPGMRPDQRVREVPRRKRALADLYVAPAIPPKKHANATAACGIRSPEDVLGLIDCTVFGSAKKGVIVTDRQIYFVGDAKYGGNRPAVFSYDEFGAAAIAAAPYSEVNDTDFEVEESVYPRVGPDCYPTVLYDAMVMIALLWEWQCAIRGVDVDLSAFAAA